MQLQLLQQQLHRAFAAPRRGSRVYELCHLCLFFLSLSVSSTSTYFVVVKGNAPCPDVRILFLFFKWDRRNPEVKRFSLEWPRWEHGPLRTPSGIRAAAPGAADGQPAGNAAAGFHARAAAGRWLHAAGAARPAGGAHGVRAEPDDGADALRLHTARLRPAGRSWRWPPGTKHAL